MGFAQYSGRGFLPVQAALMRKNAPVQEETSHNWQGRQAGKGTPRRRLASTGSSNLVTVGIFENMIWADHTSRFRKSKANQIMLLWEGASYVRKGLPLPCTGNTVNSWSFWTVLGGLANQCVGHTFFTPKIERLSPTPQLLTGPCEDSDCLGKLFGGCVACLNVASLGFLLAVPPTRAEEPGRSALLSAWGRFGLRRCSNGSDLQQLLLLLPVPFTRKEKQPVQASIRHT